MNNELQTVYLYPNDEEPVYYSPVIDCGENGGTWHRLSFLYSSSQRPPVKVSVFASNDNCLPFENKLITISDALTVKYSEQRDKIFAKAHARTYENPSDVLLHDIRARFLWFKFENAPNERILVSVSYPAQSPLAFLPEIYQETSPEFTDKFLSVFQTLYEDLESQIDSSSAFYDPEYASYEFALWLGEWLAVENILLWNPEKLGKLLKNTARLYRQRGSIDGLQQIFRYYSDCEFYITETYHAMRYYSANKALEKLYGNDRFSFWVIALGNPPEKERQGLRRILEKNTPAHTSSRLVILSQSPRIGSHCYLGLNSRLSELGKASLDGNCRMDFVSV